MLLQGYEFTVQDIVRELAKKTLVSNEPGRRIRDAVAWLKNEGLQVSFYLEGTQPKHRKWYLAACETQKLQYLQAMKKLGLA